MNRSHGILMACWAIIVGTLLFTLFMAYAVVDKLRELAKLLFVW